MSRASQGDAREKILSAAEDRLWHFGFKKTTIEEIAADARVGKGTVYLYFDSKEDIALSIMMQYKQAGLEELRSIAEDSDKDAVGKLKQMLIHPAVMAYERCRQSPMAQELLIAVRPHFQERMRPFQEQELSLIAAVLEEGNRNGMLSVTDPLLTAGRLKLMCAGFWPPYPLVEGADAIQAGIAGIVDLVFRGLRKPQGTQEGQPSGGQTL